MWNLQKTTATILLFILNKKKATVRAENDQETNVIYLQAGFEVYCWPQNEVDEQGWNVTMYIHSLHCSIATFT